jgi:serine protease Do
MTPDGLIITNKHVVSDAEAKYVVILDDGTELTTDVLAKDGLNDIAILQVTGEDKRIGELPTLTFGDSESISVGDPIIAIGNALGEYQNTATAGIISAVDRQIVASGTGFGSENLVNLIQTDAAINPGNSGGPLLNLSGEVVGMNTAIDTTASGIGFAIPSNDIATVVKSYQDNGRIVRPFVGVRYVPVTAQLKTKLDLTVDHGAYVIGDPNSGTAVVAGSPAEKAGLKEGDVILSVNGKELNENFNLQNAIASYQVGDKITLEVFRNGETIKIELTLEENIPATDEASNP